MVLTPRAAPSCAVRLYSGSVSILAIPADLESYHLGDVDQVLLVIGGIGEAGSELASGGVQKHRNGRLLEGREWNQIPGEVEQVELLVS